MRARQVPASPCALVRGIPTPSGFEHDDLSGTATNETSLVYLRIVDSIAP